MTDAGEADSPWCLYVLKCADDSLYTGITTDPDRRLHEHNHSPRGARYTRARRPVELIKTWPASNRSQASRLEYAFKALSRPEKLKLLQAQSLEELLD